MELTSIIKLTPELAEFTYELFTEFFLLFLLATILELSAYRTNIYSRLSTSDKTLVLLYISYGALFGFLSTFLVSHKIIGKLIWRIEALFCLPFITALLFACLERYIRRPKKKRTFIENFVYIFLFSFSLYAVRFAVIH